MKNILVGFALLVSSAQSSTPAFMQAVGGATTVGVSIATGADESKMATNVPMSPLRADQPFASRRAYIEAYYADTPILAKIAFCESSFRHIRNDGSVIRGAVNSGDIGVMQVNEWYHADTASRMGYDLYDLHGNLEYARNLYERQGTTPWLSSSACWRDNQS
jgi:hypothetical protein